MLRFLIPSAALCVILLLPAICGAQPANDECGSAIPVGEGDFSYDTNGANTDGPAPCASFGSDVWFLYTASCSGQVTVSTCGQANYDTALAAYPSSAGCPPAAGDAVACNDDFTGCSSYSSMITFDAMAGDSYLLQVGGWNAAQGSGTLSISCEPVLVTGLTCTSTPGSGEVILSWTNGGDFDSADITVNGDYVDTAGGPFLAGENATYTVGGIALQQIATVCMEPFVAGNQGLDACCDAAVLAEPVEEQCSAPGSPISDTLPPVQDSVTIASSFPLTDLQIDVDIVHTYIGDLTVTIESPSGTTVTLHDGQGGTENAILATYWGFGGVNGSPYDCDCYLQASGPGSLADFLGQPSDGTWTLTVTDNAPNDDGTLVSWCLRTYDVVPPVQPGPDILIGELNTFAQYGRVGDEIGCAIDTPVCNTGVAPLDWYGNPDPRHPFMVFNMYRLMDDHLEQIGLSWVKHGFGAGQADACGLGCSPYPNSTHLGVGCSDTYSAGLNASQSGLGPRSEINPWTGSFTYAGSYIDTHTGGFDDVEHRLRIHDADLDSAQNPGATYFCEVLVLAHDDVDHTNNVAWEPVSVSGSPGGSWSFGIGGSMTQVGPAIDAWSGGLRTVVQTDPPIDGRSYLSVEVTDNGVGTWHYEYALYNLDMSRMVGSFSVPIDPSIQVTNVQFHAPQIETIAYSNDAWSWVRDATSLTWSTDPYAVNPAANPLRWGTLYNFRFDADAAPVATTATLGLWLPGTPAALTAATQGPPEAPAGTLFVRGDANADGSFDISDPIRTLDFLFNMATVTCVRALDANADDTVDVADPVYALAALFSMGPMPPPPHPTCGIDNASTLTCASFASCP